MSLKEISDPEKRMEYWVRLLLLFDDNENIAQWLIKSLRGNWESPAYPAAYRPKQSSEPIDGTMMYIYNTTAGLFMQGGDSYTTQASVGKDGMTFKMSHSPSAVDTLTTGWRMSASKYQRPLFYEGDGFAYIDMASQDTYNKDCALWIVTANGDGTYRIQISPLCRNMKFKELKVDIDTDYGYKSDEYLGWVLKEKRKDTGAFSSTIVLPNANPEETRFVKVGLDWMFLTVEQYEKQHEEYERYVEEHGYEIQGFWNKMYWYDSVNSILEGCADVKKMKRKIADRLAATFKRK